MGCAQRVALQLPPRRAAQDVFKKATISRAEGGQLQALVRRQPVYGVRMGFFAFSCYAVWLVVVYWVDTFCTRFRMAHGSISQMRSANSLGDRPGIPNP